MSEEHPTELDLELLRTGEADAGVQGHVEGCAVCRERLAALRALARRIARPLAPLSVPPELDEALARRAREQGLRVQRRHAYRLPALRRVLPRAAAACVVLGLGAFLAMRALEPSPSGSSAGSEPALAAARPAAARADDINSDGRVDVVDAYLVALAVDRGRASSSWDLDGDGRVDRRDAERVARAAVALGAGAGS